MAVLREQYLKVIEHTRSGIFGRKHHWTYLLIDGQGEERTLHSTGEVLGALESRHGRQDAFLCMHRAADLFREGRAGWIGFPSGAFVVDPTDSPQ